MKRNRGGERDLDHIIMAALRGSTARSLEYPQVRAGLILMMDRTFNERQNEIIVEKACRYAPRGIVGIDIAGPRPGGGRLSLRAACAARAAGARGRSGRDGPLRRRGLRHDRESARWSSRCAPTGSGTGSSPRATRADPRCAAPGIVLEVCPTSNLLTGALADADAVRGVFRTFLDAGVP